MKTRLLLTLLLAPVLSFAQNVGINTTTPASTLAVNGSVSAGYSSQTGNYTLTASDYFVVYTGTAAATFTLPAAQSGAANFKGRVYRIKNNSAQLLSIAAAGNERISGVSAIGLSTNRAAELISTGATTGASWEVVSSAAPSYATDGLREALASAGCTSCAAYDAAAADTWVQVSSAEYTAVAGISGAGKRICSDALLNGTLTASGSNYVTFSSAYSGFGAGYISGSETMPGGQYIVAVCFGVGSAGSGSFQTKYGDVAAVGTVTNYLPVTTNAFATSGLYYFVAKRPTTALPSGGPYVFANYLSNQNLYASLTGNLRYGVGNNTTLFYGSGSNNYAYQTITTATKSW